MPLNLLAVVALAALVFSSPGSAAFAQNTS